MVVEVSYKKTAKSHIYQKKVENKNLNVLYIEDRSDTKNIKAGHAQTTWMHNNGKWHFWLKRANQEQHKIHI